MSEPGDELGSKSGSITKSRCELADQVISLSHVVTRRKVTHSQAVSELYMRVCWLGEQHILCGMHQLNYSNTKTSIRKAHEEALLWNHKYKQRETRTRIPVCSIRASAWLLDLRDELM